MLPFLLLHVNSGSSLLSFPSTVITAAVPAVDVDWFLVGGGLLETLAG